MLKKEYFTCIGLACELVHVLHEVAAQGVAVLCTNHARMLEGRVSPRILDQRLIFPKFSLTLIQLG